MVTKQEQEKTYNTIMDVYDDCDHLLVTLHDADRVKVDHDMLEKGMDFAKSSHDAIDNILDIYLNYVESGEKMPMHDVKKIEKSIREAFIDIEEFKEAVVKLN